MSSIISISNLTKVYHRDKQEIRVLNNLSLEIEKGDFVALMGPSGSGKTTLLNIIAGIDKPSSGNIIVADTNIATLSETELAKWRSRHIGFIFQFYNLIPVLTAYENVELPLMLTPLSKSERKNQVELALNVVGLGDRLHHYPKQLSGGQEQRVAIARAIASDPDIFVADEPTGDLDRVSAEEILTLLDRLNKEFGKTIVMVTHDPYAAKRAHTTHHLEKGDLLPEVSK
jgi:putative ABC transport system ATP-binding protein